MNDYEFDDIEQDTPPADDHHIEIADSRRIQLSPELEAEIKDIQKIFAEADKGGSDE